MKRAQQQREESVYLRTQENLHAPKGANRTTKKGRRHRKKGEQRVDDREKRERKRESTCKKKQQVYQTYEKKTGATAERARGNFFPKETLEVLLFKERRRHLEKAKNRGEGEALEHLEKRVQRITQGWGIAAIAGVVRGFPGRGEKEGSGERRGKE